MFIAADGYGLENSVRSGMSSILAAMKSVVLQHAAHISLLKEFEMRKRIHGYKHFIPSGIELW